MFGLRKNTAPSLDANTKQALARAERNTKAVEAEIRKANDKLLVASLKNDRLFASISL